MCEFLENNWSKLGVNWRKLKCSELLFNLLKYDSCLWTPLRYFSLKFLSHWRLTDFGGETRLSNRDGVTRVEATVEDVATTPLNSVPCNRWLFESKAFRFFVLIFSQMMTCFINVSGANLREHTGHKSSRKFCGGISMKISLSCWSSSGCWCCSGW